MNTCRERSVQLLPVPAVGYSRATAGGPEVTIPVMDSSVPLPTSIVEDGHLGHEAGGVVDWLSGRAAYNLGVSVLKPPIAVHSTEAVTRVYSSAPSNRTQAARGLSCSSSWCWCFKSQGITVTPPSRVMFYAPSARIGRVFATLNGTCTLTHTRLLSSRAMPRVGDRQRRGSSMHYTAPAVLFGSAWRVGRWLLVRVVVMTVFSVRVR